MLVVDRMFASRGTPVWGVNQFRQYLLTELLEDLRNQEKGGLTENECQAVQDALGGMIRVCESYPEKGFVKELLHYPLKGILDLYREWNHSFPDHEAGQRHRRIALKKLRRGRQKFSVRIGRRQMELAAEADEKLYLALWDEMNKISDRLPNYFPLTQRATKRARGALKN